MSLSLVRKWREARPNSTALLHRACRHVAILRLRRVRAHRVPPRHDHIAHLIVARVEHGISGATGVRNAAGTLRGSLQASVRTFAGTWRFCRRARRRRETRWSRAPDSWRALGVAPGRRVAAEETSPCPSVRAIQDLARLIQHHAVATRHQRHFPKAGLVGLALCASIARSAGLSKDIHSENSAQPDSAASANVKDAATTIAIGSARRQRLIPNTHGFIPIQ